MQMRRFDLSVDVLRQDKYTGMIYTETLKNFESAFDVFGFGCTYNYTPGDNNKSI